MARFNSVPGIVEGLGVAAVPRGRRYGSIVHQAVRAGM